MGDDDSNKYRRLCVAQTLYVLCSPGARARSRAVARVRAAPTSRPSQSTPRRAISTTPAASTTAATDSGRPTRPPTAPAVRARHRAVRPAAPATPPRSEEHTPERPSLMSKPYADFALKKKKKQH